MHPRLSAGIAMHGKSPNHGAVVCPARRQEVPSGESRARARVRVWSLRTHFLFFGLILVLPLAVLASFLIIELSTANRAQLERRIVEQARAVAAEIDRELQRRISIL